MTTLIYNMKLSYAPLLTQTRLPIINEELLFQYDFLSGQYFLSEQYFLLEQYFSPQQSNGMTYHFWPWQWQILSTWLYNLLAPTPAGIKECDSAEHKYICQLRMNVYQLLLQSQVHCTCLAVVFMSLWMHSHNGIVRGLRFGKGKNEQKCYFCTQITKYALQCAQYTINQYKAKPPMRDHVEKQEKTQFLNL